MLDGSKTISPPVAGLPLIVTVPLTSASSVDEETEGAPPPHPQQATKIKPAKRPMLLRAALAMTVSLTRCRSCPTASTIAIDDLESGVSGAPRFALIPFQALHAS